MNTAIKVFLTIVLFFIFSIILFFIREAGGAGLIGSFIFFATLSWAVNKIWKK